MKVTPLLILYLSTSLFLGCSESIKEESIDQVEVANPIKIKQLQCFWNDSLRKKGLVNVQSLDSTLQVGLRYTSLNNFLKLDLYGCLDSAFLQEAAALKLIKAQQELKKVDSSYSLYIWDAARPRSVQQAMWDSLKMPFDQKKRYVSNPKNGSIHNFGCAVDLTISRTDGRLLDMGTDFDHFGVAASINNESNLLATGVLTGEQLENRKLLRRVMLQAGFTTINSEWWHFNAMTRSEAKKKYIIIE